jgi:3-methylfumaryl-CoA hydratase
VTDQDAISKEWVGRSFEQHDILTPRLVEEFRATFAPHFAANEPIPPGLFWCLAPDIRTSDRLGPDGHLVPGQIGPDLGLPRRMWAGGEIHLHGIFTMGEPILKTSIIESISFKQGGTGPLAFLVMRRRYEQGGKLVVDERQDIVYRAAPSGPVKDLPAEPHVPLPPASTTAWIIDADPTLLFRYSAMTFNGHRIHYDHPYATGVEGYAGLVVHGPLQATLMLNLATSQLGRQPTQMRYRGVSPLIAGNPFAVIAERGGDGQMMVSTRSASGATAMTATIF